MTRRFLALHLPGLATDLIRRAEPELPRAAPLVTWTTAGPRRVLTAVDEAADAAGLRPGQALADGQAIMPALLLRPADPAGDARALHALALWARRYTPLAAADPPDGLILDVTGCDHLRGGEGALLRDALARLRRAGFTTRAAMAGAAATAAALARARNDDPIVVSGAEAVVAGPLLLGPALRLPLPVLEDLARLGLRRVCDVMALPRAPLARRFGQEVVDRLDAVTGRRASPIRPAAPPPELDAAVDLPEPILTREAIEGVLDRLLAALCARLRAAGLGARRVALLAWQLDGAVQELAIGTGLATREASHLRRLFAERLERLKPDLGFERLALEARIAEPMPAGMQEGLTTDGRVGGEVAAAILSELLDRLAGRLRVQRVVPVASHWPERSVAALKPHAVPPAAPPGWAALPWPVLLLRRPQPMEAVALVPDYPPSLLRWGDQTHRPRRAEGPLRLEPEWWRASPGVVRRDVYWMELPSGTRLWICRGGGAWRLHGHLP